MSPAEREKNDTKLLMSVAALVAGGALVIVLLAGIARNSDAEQAEVASPPERAASIPRATPPPLPAATPAAFEKTVEPSAPVPSEASPEAVYDIDPDDNLVAIGLAAFEERDFNRAAAYFLAEADERPARAWTHYMVGLSLWKAGRADEAVVAMEEAAGLDPDAIRTFVNLSRIHNDRGEFDAALEAARAALEIDLDDASAHFLEGRSLMNLGLLDEAATALERSLSIDPGNGYVQNMLGLVFIEQNRPTDAVAPLTRAAEIQPEVAYVHNNLGMALERSGSRHEAVAAYRRAVECDEDHARGAANLARLEPTLPSFPAEEPEILVAAVDVEETEEPVEESVIGDGEAADEDVVSADAETTTVAEGDSAP